MCSLDLCVVNGALHRQRTAQISNLSQYLRATCALFVATATQNSRGQRQKQRRTQQIKGSPQTNELALPDSWLQRVSAATWFMHLLSSPRDIGF
jgi:uncharacterized protein YciW